MRYKVTYIEQIKHTFYVEADTAALAEQTIYDDSGITKYNEKIDPVDIDIIEIKQIKE